VQFAICVHRNNRRCPAGLQTFSYVALLGKRAFARKIVAFFLEIQEFRLRRNAKNRLYNIRCTLRFAQANFLLTGQKVACNLQNPWKICAKKSQFSEWSCLYEEVRTYFKASGG